AVGRRLHVGRDRHAKPGRQHRKSALQLTFELVEKAPIGPIGKDLVGTGLDHSDFMQTKGEKPNRVLGVVGPPFVVRDFAQRLESIVVLGREATIDHAPRRAYPIADAVRSLENGAQRPLGRYRVLADEVSVAGQHAAKVLRPGTIYRTVDNHMADFAS